jgi:Uma2 family endonuclease
MARIAEEPAAPRQRTIPRLEPGDHLTRPEFERRYKAMPSALKAELIEGIVYMPSPVRLTKHGRQHAWLMGWLTQYEALTPGTESADNATLRLDLENEPQPDGLLRILEEHGGQSRIDEDGYVVDGPELVVEVASSSAAYDVHEKKRAYRRNGVREYLVWLVEDDRLEWWELTEGEYVPLQLDAAGHVKSRVFPGLWLDCASLLVGNLAAVLETVRQGAQSPEHAAFVKERG